MRKQPVASQSLDWCKILTRNDVPSVALTCRQYHQLLLPLLFHLFGLPPAPIQYASLTLNRYHSCKGNPPSISQYREPHVVPGSPSPDTLTMLNMAFHLTSIPRLKCTIHGGHFEVIIHQVNRLRCALQRLSVDDVELVFGPIVQDAEGRRLTPDQDVRLWTDSFGGLLNTIVRKRAKRLAIRDGAIMTKAYYHAPIAFSTSQSIFNRFTSTPFIYRATQESKYLGFSGFIRDPSLSVIAPDFPANISSQITTLEISSEIMITPPFSHWTSSLIKASPNFTTLILSNFSLLPKIWELALTLFSNCLNAAKCILTSFSLTWCSSPPKPSLIEFLHNLPNLTTLILG
ncbi:hypothetical protein BDN72DRAFT_108130 [Pluteus cervinus]|uniref:Uncharacterized protein n=1 Tax=Pluteus cervinus TaxID=181527 RepID=A0ACD3APS7_9AGAR|nr:hypothetical protein BDN72DRAFT_108130 [Pluteus cervinus]